jgi:hemerythrin
LVDLVDALHEAIHQRQGSGVARDVLGKLAVHTRIHFAVEESRMRILGYPDSQEHKAQHGELIQSMLELQQKFVSGAAIGFELTHFLKIWLTRHIMENDQRYGQYVVETGAKVRFKQKSWAGSLWDHLHV